MAGGVVNHCHEESLGFVFARTVGFGFSSDAVSASCGIVQIHADALNAKIWRLLVPFPGDYAALYILAWMFLWRPHVSCITTTDHIFPKIVAAPRIMSNLWYQAAFILFIIMIRFMIQWYNNSQRKTVNAPGKKTQ